MAQFPRPSKVNMDDPLVGFTAEQASVSSDKPGGSKVIDGKSLLDAKAPGKLNENRFTSLKPRRNDK